MKICGPTGSRFMVESVLRQAISLIINGYDCNFVPRTVPGRGYVLDKRTTEVLVSTHLIDCPHSL